MAIVSELLKVSGVPLGKMHSSTSSSAHIRKLLNTTGAYHMKILCTTSCYMILRYRAGLY